MAESAGWRWVPHAEHVWVPARKKLERVWTTIDNEDIEYKQGEIDESKLEGVSEISLGKDLDNLVNLDEFGEGAIIHQLRKRYIQDKIYTNIGTILVSVNPYKLLAIYTSSSVDKYREDYTNMAPHAFQIAADAYKRLLDEGMNQAVIISGESGAGKTEATKTVLQYLSDVAGSTSNVEQQILQSNPCLEAFGNAKTLRNDNSSRFGKWMEVVFAVGGRICAARVINYLLEKSRVVKQAQGERNYHIFYQVTKALPKDIKDKIFLKEAGDYLYLKQSGCFTIPGVDEHTELGKTIKAMQNLSFSDTEIHQMWVVLSAILNLGNLKFAADKSKDGTTISNTDQLEIIAKVLQLNNATLTTALTFRSVTIRGSVSMIPLKLEEAVENCDSLAKALYGKMFDWLIKKVNETLMKVPATDDMMTIGILDIFGFEIFEQNAFEQFCINYANEKLQQHFNEHIFKLEQDEYKREKIDVSFIEFIDNIECLKLIEGNPVGILKMLDEEVTIPKGGDKSLITKMHKKFAEETKHAFYGLIRKSPEVFIIKHYAGAVVYDSTGMVNKNRDKLHDSLTDLVQQSEVALVRTIFAPEPAAETKAEEKAPATPAPAPGGAAPKTARAQRAAAAKAAGGKGTIAKGGGGGGGGAKGVRTLCVQFYSQLSSLMKTLHAANPHYIRCVKPNALKTPGTFNSKMVLRQMQYAGLFEAIRIRRAGFPFRVPHAEFVARYRVCMKAQDIKALNDLKGDDVKQANFLLTQTFGAHLDKKEYQMGVSKVFMRNSQRLILTRLRDTALTECVLKIQAFQRGNNARKFYVKVKAFNEKCKKVKGDRNMDTLRALIQEALEADIELFILEAVKGLLKYLEEEKRVSVILEEGCKENELAGLEGGLEQVSVLKSKYPDEPWADYYAKLVAQAESQKQALIRKDRARKGLATAIQNEDIKELQAAIQEAKDAGLAAGDWAEAQKLLERLEYEEQCIQDLEKAVTSNDLQAIEEKLVAAEQVTLDAKRKEIIGNAKEALKKGHFEKMKAHMIAAGQDLPNHLPTHEGDVPADQLPLPPEEKLLTETIIPKLESLKYHDLLQQAKAFLLDQLKKRLQAQKEAHFNHLQATLKASEEESKSQLPNFEVDTPAKDLPLPPLEAKIKQDIIPRLEKLEYKEYVTEASLFLEKQLGHRTQALLESHHEHLQTTLKKAEEDSKNHVPNHEIDVPAPEIPLPPVEKDIKENILPKLTKLGYNDFVATAEAFLAAQLGARESALKHAHHDYLEVIIKEAEKESPQYMPTVENDKPVETLPPAEGKIKDQILPKLTKLSYNDLINTATGFLEAQREKREAESLRIITEKKEAERKRLEEEERIRREEERKKREEEERRRLEEERKKEEERLATERAQLQEAERKRLEEEDRKRREAEEKALAERLARERAEEEAKAKALAEEKEREAQKAKEAAEKKRLESEAKLEEQRRKNEADYQQQKAREEKEKEAAAKKLAEQRAKQEEEYRREKEEQEKKQKAIEEAEKAAQSAAEASKAKVRAHAPTAYPPGTVGADGLPPPPPDDDFNMPPPPPPEDLKWQATEQPDSQEIQQAEHREEELNKAIKARSLSLITTLLVDADKFGDKTRTVRIARNLKDVLTEERKILNQLKQCLKELNVNPLKSLLREAANLGLDNPVISEARHLCYGMSKSELLTKRITLALKNRDAEKLNALLDEAKEDGIENEEVEHARDFVAMTLDLGDWNSKMRVARSRTVSGISASQAASYKGFLETKGLYPLRKFTNLRKEGNYAKKNYFRKKNLKKKRLVWQKEDIPRSLVKLSTSHCGGQKKSKLVKKIAKQIFKNIRGYMGDHYHAYPVTLAYEVVNTGVNEELLRDEIFAQLIKQTTKNPSLDSRTLGWKLLYLCVSTFWPSQELRPILVSHLAAHAPPKINKREFGFNTIADLAYHCYIALDDKSPPANEPPSMQDIEKITNGTLGAVKSFFSMDPDEDEEGGEQKGEPTTVTENMDAELEQNGVAPPSDPFPPTPQVVFKQAPPPPPPQPRASMHPSQPHPPMDGPPPPDD